MEAGESGGGTLFRRLSGGRGGSLSPEEVAANQRGRLQGAMIAAAARQGYAGTTLRELVELAGVSKTTFYEHYSSKEELFRATYAGAEEAAISMIVGAYLRGDGFRDRLRSGVQTFCDVVGTNPPAATLVVVESLALGADFAAEREATAIRFEELLTAGFGEGGNPVPSPTVIRGIVGGFRRLVYRALRDRRPEQLDEDLDQVLAWIFAYGAGAAKSDRPATARTRDRSPDGAAAEEETAIGWHEPPDSKLARRVLTQRQRIMRAAAQRAAAVGYAKLTVPSISSAAGVSNQTFYEEFGGKLDAFLAAFEALSAPLMATIEHAFEAEESWQAGVSAAVSKLLHFLAGDRLVSRLAFFELPAAGAQGLDHADDLVDRLTAPLRPTPSHPAPAAPPPVAFEAIPGGILTILQAETRKGRRGSLPELHDGLCEFILTPFEAD